MNIKRGMLVGAIVLLGTGCQALGTKENVKLSAEEVTQLFTEQTVESYNLSSGVTSFTYYAADGSVVQERYWGIRKGQWKVNDAGEICLSMEGKPFKCREIHQVGDRYYKYRQTKKGQFEKIVRYRQFISGKAI